MSDRTALLIRCSAREARTIRGEAEIERRTVSHYILNIVMRALLVEERLFHGVSQFDKVTPVPRSASVRKPGPRTAILVRCSVAEAKRIRAAAARRRSAINEFVLACVRRSWLAKQSLPALPPLLGR